MIKYIIILLSVYIGLIFTYYNILTLIDSFSEEEQSIDDIKEYPYVSIIVPAYNEGKNIELTLKSLINLEYPKEKLEIIVVDDGSKDNTYEIAKQFAEKYEFIKVFKKENGGKASALNYGISKSKGEFIVTMDADSEVPSYALKKMLPKFFISKDIAAVIPAIQIIKAKTLLEKIQYIEYAFNNILRKIFENMNSIYVTPGPFSIFRKKILDEIGYFDEKDITEDMEIAFRIHSFGYKIKYVPDVVVKTIPPNTIKGLIKQRIRWYLGFLENVSKYYRILKYKNTNLSKFVIPSAFLFIIIPILLIGIYAYDSVKGIIKSFEYYGYINFDIIPELKYFIESYKYFLSWDYFTLKSFVNQYWTIIFSIVSIGSFLIMIKIALDYEKKSIKNIILYLILYIYIYLILYTIFWVSVLLAKCFAKEIRWGGLVWKNSLINKIIYKNKGNGI